MFFKNLVLIEKLQINFFQIFKITKSFLLTLENMM